MRVELLLLLSKLLSISRDHFLHHHFQLLRVSVLFCETQSRHIIISTLEVFFLSSSSSYFFVFFWYFSPLFLRLHPELNNNHVIRSVKRENQLNSHFLLHRLPFYVSFLLVCCLFIISLLELLNCASLSFLQCDVYLFILLLLLLMLLVVFGWFFVFFSLFLHSRLSRPKSQHHSFRFINLQPFAAFVEIKE